MSCPYVCSCYLESYKTDFGGRTRIINSCTGESMGSGFDQASDARYVMERIDACYIPCCTELICNISVI